MKKVILALIVSISCSIGNAYADYQLLQKNNCFACHYIEKRKYGPKFKDVAAKYKGTDQAAEYLAKKIKSGGTGLWGEDVMPPQDNVTEDDALLLANYILTLE